MENPNNLVVNELSKIFKDYLNNIDITHFLQIFLELFDLESVLERILTKIIKENFRIEDYFVEKSTLHGNTYFNIKKLMKEQIESIIAEKESEE